MKNNIGVIIEARLNSSRLPNKHLKVILDIPLIIFIYKIKESKKYFENNIITTDSKRDDKLENLAKKQNICLQRRMSIM